MINYYELKYKQTSLLLLSLQELIKICNDNKQRINLLLDITTLQCQLKVYQALMK